MKKKANKTFVIGSEKMCHVEKISYFHFIYDYSKTACGLYNYCTLFILIERSKVKLLLF